MVEYNKTDDGVFIGLPEATLVRGEAAGIPKRFRQAHLYEQSGAIAEVCRKYVIDWPQETGMVLVGSTGFGKTHYACATVNELLRCWSDVRDVSAYYFNVNTTLARALDSRYFRRYDAYTSIVRNMTQCDILIVDDLLHVPNQDFAKDVLYRIYEERYASLLPTITTLNADILDGDDGALDWGPVSDTFNEPFMRRLVETASDNVLIV